MQNPDPGYGPKQQQQQQQHVLKIELLAVIP